MTVFVEPKKKTAAVLTLALFLLAAAAAVTANFVSDWRGILYLIAVAGFTAAIQLSQRYLLSGYEYILDAEEDLLRYNRLTVIRVTGQKRTSVFTVPLLTLKDVIPYRKPSALRKEYGTVTARMDFSADLFPAVSHWLLFEADGVLTAVRLQCGEDFAETLRRRAGF